MLIYVVEVARRHIDGFLAYRSFLSIGQNEQALLRKHWKVKQMGRVRLVEIVRELDVNDNTVGFEERTLVE